MKYKKPLVVISVVVTALIIGVYFYTTNQETLVIDDTVHETNYDRYNKVVDKAVEANNPDICNEIDFGQWLGDYTSSAEKSRYFCKADYAVKASDVDYCKTLDSEVEYTGSIAQRDKCLRDLAKKLNDKSLCEFLSDKIYCPIK